MTKPFEASSTDFLELASEQRLLILRELSEKQINLMDLTRKIQSTKSHVFRDLQRLQKADMIEKNSQGEYRLTIYGKSIRDLIPSIVFVSSNKNYFKTHNFGNIPTKFVQRIGALSEGKLITGYTRIIENWKKLIENSEEYIYGILVEEPAELLTPILKKATNNIQVQSVFSSSAIISESREKIIKKFNLKKLLDDGTIQRRVMKEINLVVLLNEKEACVSFPNNYMEHDLGKNFYSTHTDFHEWCLDYFRFCWHNSKVLRKIKS